jgi:futalosine hydrolase
VEARTCGIGLSAAAVHSSVQVREVRPRAVVLLGTCGVYRGFAPTGQSDRAELGIGDVIVSRRVLLADWATLEGHAQFPPATAAPLSADEHLTESLARAGAAPADVANTLGITVNDNVAARIAKSTGAGVEHLETYGVATACAAAGVPFAAVLGVANFVGSSGREEWRGHHVRASEAAAQLVLAWMQSIDDLGPHLGLRAS